MNEQTARVARPSPSHTPRLSWPPPGFENMQGELWRVIGEFCVGVVVFAVPLLIAIAFDQSYWTLGPFGQSWWIPAVAAVLGMVILFIASARLSRMLRRAAAATRLGYGLGTIAMVVSDGGRDSGFVLQGARAFAGMSVAERRTLLMIRLGSALAYLLAALWIPVGLAIAFFLGAADTIGGTGVAIVTIAPAVVLLLVGVLARTGERIIVSRQRAGMAGAVEDDVRREAAEWSDNLDLLADEVAIGSRRAVRPRAFTAAAVAVVVPAVLLLIPVSAVITAAAMGPVFIAIAPPSIGSVQQRMAVAEALRGYRAPIDETVSAAQAGAAMINLSYVGREYVAGPPLLPPQTLHPAFAQPPEGWELQRVAGSGAIFGEIREGLTPERREYLAAAAVHPAHAEFATIGRAEHADILGARLQLPIPDSMAVWSVPILKFGAIRESSYMHIAKAGFEFMEGRPDDAERTLKEVIGLGYVLIDDGTFLIENLIGNVLLGMGVQALEEFYRASGRTADADALAARRDGAEQAAAIATSFEVSPALPARLAQMREVVGNDDAMRGMRWEMFMLFNTAAPCINLRNVVFGPGDAHQAWQERIRQDLVRYPAEAELFALVRNGFVGDRSDGATPRCLRTSAISRFYSDLRGSF